MRHNTLATRPHPRGSWPFKNDLVKRAMCWLCGYIVTDNASTARPEFHGSLVFRRVGSGLLESSLPSAKFAPIFQLSNTFFGHFSANFKKISVNTFSSILYSSSFFFIKKISSLWLVVPQPLLQCYDAIRGQTNEKRTSICPDWNRVLSRNFWGVSFVT